MKYPHILAAFPGQRYWAIDESALVDFNRTLGLDNHWRAEMSELAKARRAGASPSSGGGIMAIPVMGVIEHHESIWEAYGFTTSCDTISAACDRAAGDAAVGTVALVVDSPGGTISGVPELSDKIHALSKVKNVVAIANASAFSAAYWIASSAGKMYCTPSGAVGSIGVIVMHQELSGMAEAAGVKTSIIRAPENKGEGNSWEPLSADARAAIQKEVDTYYGMFVSAVARNRGTSQKDVRAGYGNGRIVTATDAMNAGMVDKVLPMDQMFGALAGRGGQSRAGSRDPGTLRRVAQHLTTAAQVR